MTPVIIKGLEIDPSLDGESHINIYSNGGTELGRLLSNFTYLPSDTPHGEFASLEGYYHYLKILISLERYKCNAEAITSRGEAIRDLYNRIEALRGMYGRAAQQRGRKIRAHMIKASLRVQDRPNNEFNRCFRYALLSKVLGNKNLYEQLLESRLPLVHYYQSPMGEVIYQKRFDWLPDHIEAIRLNLLGVNEKCMHHTTANHE